jgi:sugar-specific transcriptional regulator TrmB
MDDQSSRAQAVELLQELGLKEYEARCFVALVRLDRGTAKRISEVSEVPRTRVYDAVRVLEAKGLVGVQHTSPQQFGAVTVEEATEILRGSYEDRIDSLGSALAGVEPLADEADREATHEVWALTGRTSVDRRARTLIDEATTEVVVVVGDPEALTGGLVGAIGAATDRGLEVVVGAVTDDLRETAAEALPGVEVFTSELGWLSPADPDDHTTVTCLLMLDRSAIMFATTADGREHGVFGRGYGNGLVTVARRLLVSGLLPERDPGVASPPSTGERDVDDA